MSDVILVPEPARYCRCGRRLWIPEQQFCSNICEFADEVKTTPMTPTPTPEFSGELPTSEGYFLWKKNLSHTPTPVRVYISDVSGVVWCVKNGNSDPVAMLGGFWLRLVPVTCVKDAWEECIQMICDDVRGQGIGVYNGWEVSQAKRLTGGQEK